MWQSWLVSSWSSTLKDVIWNEKFRISSGWLTVGIPPKIQFNAIVLHIHIIYIIFLLCICNLYNWAFVGIRIPVICFKVLPKQQLTWNFFESQNGGPNESSDAKNDDPESSLTWSDANCSARKESSVDSASFEFWISRDADSKFRFKIWKYKNRCFENWCLMG